MESDRAAAAVGVLMADCFMALLQLSPCIHPLYLNETPIATYSRLLLS
jgi:hypothetical protein